MKDDGSFAFADVKAVVPQDVLVTANGYQARLITQSLPGTAPVELTYPGEDELYVFVKQLVAGQQKVVFDKLSFVPTIETGSPVIGEGGFTSTVAQAVEGDDVQSAILASVTGLGVGTVLRFVRSHRLLLRPGPSYPFAPDATVVAISVVENTATHPPVADADVTVTKINGNAITDVLVGTVTIKTAIMATAPPPPKKVILGTASAIATQTDGRGRCVYYYPPDTAITGLQLAVVKSGYIAATVTVGVTPQTRTATTVQLTPA